LADKADEYLKCLIISKGRSNDEVDGDQDDEGDKGGEGVDVVEGVKTMEEFGYGVRSMYSVFIS
jgi:hypothetical protein